MKWVEFEATEKGVAIVTRRQEEIRITRKKQCQPLCKNKKADIVKQKTIDNEDGKNGRIELPKSTWIPVDCQFIIII